MLERWAHRDHVRVGLAVGWAGEAVEAVAADTAAGFAVGFVKIEADRKVERSVAGRDEVVVQLLDSWFMRHGRIGETTGPRRLGWVLPRLAVNQIEALSLGVVGPEVAI